MYGGWWGDDYSTADQGGAGYYWSSTQVNAQSAFGLYFGSSWAYPETGDGKAAGYAVRCVQG
jgi:uncharacterized protein (TIGR02145 family)